MTDQLFTQTYNLYYKDLYRFIFSFLRASDKVEDIIQETFIKFYDKAPNDESKFKDWLFSVSKNLCMDALRKEKREKEYLQTVPQKTSDTDESNVDLMEALDSLSPKYSEPIRLFYFANLNLKEIAKNLSISEDAVKKRLQRGREQLKEILEEKENGGHW